MFMKDQRRYHQLRLHFDLVQEQRKAVKISVAIFNETKQIETLLAVSILLQKSIDAKCIEDVNQAIAEMIVIANDANIALPK